MSTPSQLDRARLLASLDIPAETDAPTEASREGFGADVACRLDRLVGDQLVDTLWNHWNPEYPQRLLDPTFRRAFRSMLSRGAGLGLRLSRFRSVSRSMPDPTPDGSNWIAPFEGAAAAAGVPSVRLRLNAADHAAFLASSSEPETERWQSKLALMRDGLFYELGLLVPPLDVDVDESLQEAELRVELNDAALPRQRGLTAAQLYVNQTVANLGLMGIRGESCVGPSNQLANAIVGAEHKAACETAGLTTWDGQGYAILVVSALIRDCAGALVNRYMVDHLLEQLANVSPRLLREVEQRVDRDHLVQVLRALLAEQVSIRNLPTVLGVLVSRSSPVEVDVDKNIIFGHGACSLLYSGLGGPAHDDAARVREALSQSLTHQFTRGTSTMLAYLMAPTTERRLRNPRPLDPHERDALLDAVRTELQRLPPTAQVPAILTGPDVRWRFREELRTEFPHLKVASYRDLSPYINIQPIARIDASFADV